MKEKKRENMNNKTRTRNISYSLQKSGGDNRS